MTFFFFFRPSPSDRMTTVIVTLVSSLAIAQSIFGSSRFFGQGKEIQSTTVSSAVRSVSSTFFVRHS